MAKALNRKADLDSVVSYYLNGPKFLRLSGKSQKEYEAQLHSVLHTVVEGGKRLGSMQAKSIRLKHISDAYEQWLTVGTRTANMRVACLSAAWRYAMQKEIVDHNPITLLDRVNNKPRRVKWERDQVKLFLSTAYGDFKWRSIGLIVHMAYEWGQRVGDMRLLKWSNLDLDAQRLDLTQSKRNADVHLPISNNLTTMLKQQREDFGFQPYVAPRTKPQAGAYTPYSLEEVSGLLNQVKELAGLPEHLTAMDLRRTAITEMLEGGVDMAGIMQVSGHRNPNSVKPYMLNTFSGASKALAARGGDDD
jgi:integrase